MAVQSLSRTFDILELLAGTPGGLGLTEIGARAGLPKSTAFRIVTALEERGYIERQYGRYVTGPVLVDLCTQHLARLDLKLEARPILARLCQTTGQTVFLAVLREDSAVYIDAFETFDSLRKYAIIGQRRPLYCSGLGKALAMGMTETEIREVARRQPLVRHTDTTLTDIDTLLNDLSEARRRGWAADDRELEPDIRCVAAPIRDFSGIVIAAVSASWQITGPAAPELPVMGRAVSAAAAEVSARLGYRTVSSS